MTDGSIPRPGCPASERHAEACRQLDQARTRFDRLVRQGADTTNAAYELSLALAVAELAERQAGGIDAAA